MKLLRALLAVVSFIFRVWVALCVIALVIGAVLYLVSNL